MCKWPESHSTLSTVKFDRNVMCMPSFIVPIEYTGWTTHKHCWNSLAGRLKSFLDFFSFIFLSLLPSSSSRKDKSNCKKHWVFAAMDSVNRNQCYSNRQLHASNLKIWSMQCWYPCPHTLLLGGGGDWTKFFQSISKNNFINLWTSPEGLIKILQLYDFLQKFPVSVFCIYG